MFDISPTTRLRASPFYESALAEGITAGTVYNNMILPTSYGDPEAEYWRIIEGVSQWDVGVERQVQLKGPDAGRLAQILSPRDLSKCKVGQGKYVPLCNHKGTLINDPILLKLADDLYWLSIADSDIWFWARAIAAERGLDVEVSEPDVSPMAIQGPKAEDVVASVFGDWVRDIKYFWFKETELQGIPVERTESGLVSVGGDTDSQTNPFEVRLGQYVDLDVSEEVVGIKALREIAEAGPKRHQLGVILEGDTPEPMKFSWESIWVGEERVGDMTNCVWSPRLRSNIGYALISRDFNPGDSVAVNRGMYTTTGKLVELPFI